MLVLLWLRQSLAETVSLSSAQRMPLTLWAVMEMPMPVVQTRLPRSHAPDATARAAGIAKSG